MFALEIRTDRRTLIAEPKPRVHAWLLRQQPRCLEQDLRYARAFDEIATSRHYLLQDCASITAYGEVLGYDAPQVRRWQAIGLVLRSEGRAEARVRSGHLSLEKLVLLEPIYAHPENLRKGDDWLCRAESSSPRALRTQVRRRQEEVAHRKEVRARNLMAPADTWDKFDRARDVASSRARRRLTEGETLDVVAETYLDRHDPLRRAGRRKAARGKPPSPPPLPGGRKPPSEVWKWVWVRAGGTCEFPGCRHRMGLELAHIRGHAAGGPQHPRNLLLLCGRHHTLFDAGRLRFLGWDERERPLFEKRRVTPNSAPRAPPRSE